MSTRKEIVMAVANGCRNTRQVAEYLRIPHGTVSGYFYKNSWVSPQFENGDLVQWDTGRANTIRLGPNVAVIRRNGKIVDVGRIEEVN